MVADLYAGLSTAQEIALAQYYRLHGLRSTIDLTDPGRRDDPAALAAWRRQRADIRRQLRRAMMALRERKTDHGA